MYQVLSFQVREVIFEIAVSLDPTIVSKVVFIILYVRKEYEPEFAVMLLAISMGTVGFDMAVAMVYFVVVAIICSVVVVIVCSMVVDTTRSVVIANQFRVIAILVVVKDGFIFTVEVSTILISTGLFTQDQDAQDVEVFLFQVKTVFNAHIALIFSIKDLQRLDVVEVFPFLAETTFNEHIALI